MILSEADQAALELDEKLREKIPDLLVGVGVSTNQRLLVYVKPGQVPEGSIPKTWGNYRVQKVTLAVAEVELP